MSGLAHSTPYLVALDLMTFVNEKGRMLALGDHAPPWRCRGRPPWYVVQIHALIPGASDRWGQAVGMRAGLGPIALQLRRQRRPRRFPTAAAGQLALTGDGQRGDDLRPRPGADFQGQLALTGDGQRGSMIEYTVLWGFVEYPSRRFGLCI
jgi:hypothetical protein